MYFADVVNEIKKICVLIVAPHIQTQKEHYNAKYDHNLEFIMCQRRVGNPFGNGYHFLKRLNYYKGCDSFIFIDFRYFWDGTWNSHIDLTVMFCNI